MYERTLIEYLPNFIRDVKEIKEIMNNGEQPEMVSIWNTINDVFNDQFINDATENGVSRWEKILRIVPKATFTLDERKFTILTRINEQLPFTMRTLEESLKSLCGANGYILQLKANEYVLVVKIALTAKNNLTDVEQLLKRVIPANMVVQLTLMYNNHETFGGYTHQALTAFTHNQLRNEVFTHGN